MVCIRAPFPRRVRTLNARRWPTCHTKRHAVPKSWAHLQTKRGGSQDKLLRHTLHEQAGGRVCEWLVVVCVSVWWSCV